MVGFNDLRVLFQPDDSVNEDWSFKILGFPLQRPFFLLDTYNKFFEEQGEKSAYKLSCLNFSDK